MYPFYSRYRNLSHLFLLRSALVTGCLISSTTVCGTVFGAEEKLVPTCEIKEEFNDNVFLTAGDRKSDFITTISPNLTFSRISERLNIDLLTGVSWYDYSRSAGVGSMDYKYNAQMAGKLTPRDDLGLSAAYVRNSRPDSINQADWLNTNRGRDHYQYSASMRRLLNETTSSSIAYTFVQDSYDNQAYQGNHVHNAALVVSKDLSDLLPLLKGTLSSNFSRAIYRDSSSDNYTLSAGASRSINEKLSVNLSVGGRFTHSTFRTTYEVKNDSTGAVGSASLNYAGEKTSGSLSFVRNFSAASGQVGPVETTTFGVALGQGLSDKTTAQISASYNINQASSGQFSTRSSDDKTLNLKADIIYKMSKFFDIGLQYAYYTVNYSFNDSQVTQNSVMLRAVAKYPFTR